MPELGEVKCVRRTDRPCNEIFIWFECPQCKQRRWLRRSCMKSPTFTGLCHSCTARKYAPTPTQGPAHSSWTDGRHHRADGYIERWISPDDFFHPMVNHHNYILEHRLVMAQYLKRHLLAWEIIHHINGIKDDNRIENLVLLKSKAQHMPYTRLEREVKKQAWLIEGLQRKITELEIEIVFLKGEKNVNECPPPWRPSMPVC